MSLSANTASIGQVRSTIKELETMGTRTQATSPIRDGGSGKGVGGFGNKAKQHKKYGGTVKRSSGM